MVVFRKALERRRTGSERVAQSLRDSGHVASFTVNRWRRRTGGKVYTEYLLTLTPLGEQVAARHKGT